MEQQNLNSLFDDAKAIRKKWLFIDKTKSKTAIVCFPEGLDIKTHDSNSGFTHEYADCIDMETGEDVRLKLHGDLKAQLEATNKEQEITPKCAFKITHSGSEPNEGGPDFQIYDVRRARMS